MIVDENDQILFEYLSCHYLKNIFIKFSNKIFFLKITERERETYQKNIVCLISIFFIVFVFLSSISFS